jgi:hypothetical protein
VGKWNRAAVKIQNLLRYDASSAEFTSRMHAVGVIRRFILQSFSDKLAARKFLMASKVQGLMRGALSRRRGWHAAWSAIWIQKEWRSYVRAGRAQARLSGSDTNNLREQPMPPSPSALLTITS